MEIDQDDLRTGTAIGYRASHEHWLKFLVFDFQRHTAIVNRYENDKTPTQIHSRGKPTIRSQVRA